MNPNRSTTLFTMALPVILFFNLWGGEAAAESVLALGQYPENLISKYHYLFWTDGGETVIKRTPICGGETIALAPKMGLPINLSIKGQYIFWIDQRSGGSPSGSCIGRGVTWILNKSSMDGASKTELARGDNCSYGADDIVVDEADVYWVNSTATPNEFFIKRVPIAGGDSITLVSSQFNSIDELAGDATHIYWIEFDNDLGSTIKRMLKNGGQVEILAGGLNKTRGGLAIYDGEIFFSTTNGNYTYELMKISVSGGSPITLATVTRDPFEGYNWARAITVDNENLYWIDHIAVNAIPVDGGSVTKLANILLDEAMDITVNEGHVFWTEASGRTGTAKSVSTSGGSVNTLIQVDDATNKLVLFNSDIYWTEGKDEYGDEMGTIAKGPVSGGNAQTIIWGVARGSPPIASDGRYLYIADNRGIKKLSIAGGIPEMLSVSGATGNIEYLATDGTNVYWTGIPLGIPYKMPVSGGQPILLSSSPTGHRGPIRVHNEYVYWMQSNTRISKVGVDGNGFLILATDLPYFEDFVVDDTHVFFAEHDTRRIRKISINGGPISTIFSFSSLNFPPYHLALDEHSLYWISSVKVGAMLKDGGSPTIIDQEVLSDIYGNGSIAVDPTGVYWTETYIGAIMKHELGACYQPMANPFVLFLLLGE